MIQLKIYKTNGTMKFAEVNEDTKFTFKDDGKDENGAYFVASADTISNAFYIMELGLKALQDSLRSSAAAIDNLLGSIKLQSSLIGLQSELDEKKPEKLVE